MKCACGKAGGDPRLVVLTGGPGAGKTAVLEVAARTFYPHVEVLPEAATIVFGGGFPRRSSVPAREAAQRAIASVQRELERLGRAEGRAAVLLCDRGILDSLAYWPGDPADYFAALGTTRAQELSRYAAVIHLRTPSAAQGYNHANPLRTEGAEEAATIDARIAEIWAAHPRRFVVPCRDPFVAKLAMAMEIIGAELPPGCVERNAATSDEGRRAS